MSFNCTNTCIKIRFFRALRIINCIHVNIDIRILLLVSSKSYKYSFLLSIVVFVQNLCDTQGPEGSICMQVFNKHHSVKVSNQSIFCLSFSYRIYLKNCIESQDM